MARIEMILYHGISATSTLQVSSVTAGPPWTDLVLTSAKTITDALAEWEALAEAAFAKTWAFGRTAGTSEITFAQATGGSPVEGFVKLTPALADLLGFSTTSFSVLAGVASDQSPLGLVDILDGNLASGLSGLAVGVTFPLDAESGELLEYRGARAAAYHYGRAIEVVVDLFVSAELWAVAEGSPLFGGHVAMALVQDDETAWSESHQGGKLTVYPIETVSVERQSPGDHVWVRLRCTTADPA